MAKSRKSNKEELLTDERDEVNNDLGPDDFMPPSHARFAARLDDGVEMRETDDMTWWTHRRRHHH